MTVLQIIQGIFLFITLIIVGLIILILLQKGKHKRFNIKTSKAQDRLEKTYNNEKALNVLHKKMFSLRQYMTLQDQIILDDIEQITVVESLKLYKLVRKLKRQASCLIPHIRLIAYHNLSCLMSVGLKDFYLKKLKSEKRENIKFIIVYGLIKVMDTEIFEAIMDTLEGSSKEYQKRLSIILNNHYNDVCEYIPKYLNSESHLIKLCLLRTSIKNGNKEFSSFVEKNIERYINEYTTESFSSESSLDLMIVSLQYILTYHHRLLIENKLYIKQKDRLINRYIVDAYAKEISLESLKQLLKLYELIEYDEYNSIALSKLVNEEQRYLLYIIDQYHTFSNQNIKKYVIRVLVNKMEYILLKVNDKDGIQVKRIIKDILSSGYTSAIIEFLNQNNNTSIERSLLNIIEPLMIIHENIDLDFRTYLDVDILTKLKKQKYHPIKPVKTPPKRELSKIIWIYSVVFFTVLLFPLIYVIRYTGDLGSLTFIDMFRGFVNDNNYYLIYYYFIANFIYIILIFLSFYGAKKQLRLWKIKSDSLLFEENLLPSISVLAPAYNEELSIVESVSSLLNLKYPEYEIVVINDGSSDKTLQTVIDHFQLKRRNRVFDNQLEAKAIRGIYTNKDFPNLIVVDKVNGGKADALNVGINVSSKEYVCGIDADSVLDADALLRLSAVTLDEQYPIIAFGGNIVPANGCTINKGKVEQRGFADGLVPRFQALEYLRAFTTGRVGWSQLNSLLIISGAFGLFKRQSIIRIGGYITSSGILKKDSVGEDMELVVRLTDDALKNKEKYYVKYIFHANCYTELPSDMKTLLRQRNRWHRGLVDILSYYRRMFLNPKYKQVGLLAIPYFYFFEVMGPMIEVIGYTMLIFGFIFGLLDATIVLGVFTASIWLGIIISLSSVYVAEFDESSFSKKDIGLLILFAILENFGYRQLLSFHRAYSLFTALKESGKWGEQKRKGITAK